MALANSFKKSLQRSGWLMSSTDIYYPDVGDTIADSAAFMLGIHKAATGNHTPIRVAMPPIVHPDPLASFVYKPFNSKEYAISLARHQPDFDSSGCTVMDPVPTVSHTKDQRAKCIYHLHRACDDKGVSAGSGVYCLSGLCPPFCASNNNVFASTFGIEFDVDEDKFVRPVSAYEVTSCFKPDKYVTYFLSHPESICLIDCGIPAATSRLFLGTILSRLNAVNAESFEISMPRQISAPAATACIPTFVNGAIGSRIPDNHVWSKALTEDHMTRLLLDIVASPTLGQTQAVVQKLDYIYRQPARQGNFAVRDTILFMKEIFQNDDKYVELKIVPESLRNIIFVAFHSNPIGGHLNAYRTYHRIRQRYFWPGMFQYIKKMCNSCPGCSLSNITKNRSADLVYSFPIEAPMKVLFVDIYAAGAEINFVDTKYYLIAVCGMTSFAIAEDTAEQNSTVFASALMRIWLRFGFSHTIVVDKDSKFLGEFQKMAALLMITIHVLSGENHDPMIVEKICRYLNSCLTIFCNERGNNRVALEGILMSLYAWNSAPVIGTDISRSLLVTGREFNFPIDFSTEQHQLLTSTPLKVNSFAADQARLLTCSRELAKELIHSHRAYHREHINKMRPDPRVYSIGDHVFAKRAVKSDKRRGLVGKLMNEFTGPWVITAKLKGSSYEIRHKSSGVFSKRHAAHISPYPDQLLPFMPVDGPDNRFGQLHTPIQKDPYINAGLKGFAPTQPFKIATAISAMQPLDDIKFPSLAELNANCFQWAEGEEDLVLNDNSLCEEIEIFAVTRSQSAAPKRSPPPPIEAPAPSRVPDIGPLTASILSSKDKLFFVAHKIPGSNQSEWVLVRVDLNLSVKAHPAALQDGRFLCQFYACHPADKRYNAINQQYWLEYHPKFEVANPYRNRHTNMIRPSSQSESYADAEGLAPFTQWLRMTNADTYIAGPFDFAEINGRKSRDRVPEDKWKLLSKFGHMFNNEVPSISLPDYSVHFGQFHTIYDVLEDNSRISAYLANPSSPTTV